MRALVKHKPKYIFATLGCVIIGTAVLALGGWNRLTARLSMSLRDWLAGMALQSIVTTALSVETAWAFRGVSDESSKDPVNLAAEIAYEVADAMLRARDNPPH